MSSSTTIYNSAPFIGMGSVAPTKHVSSLGTGIPGQWDAFADQGHPGPASSRMKMFEPYFGVRPSDKGFEVNPYTQMWNWQQENYTLPDAYVGNNMYILNILITSIFLGDQWPVTECLPWKLKEDSMEIQWQEWHFNDHMLDRSPEETLPRTLTSTRTQHSAGMKRYGKACTFEDGFLSTPMGKTQWAMSLKQIYNAVVETACFEVIFVLMKTPAAHDHLAEFRGSGTVSSDTTFVRNIMEQAELMFLPQKRSDGWVTLMSKYIADFKNRNRHEPNGLIIPQGTRQYQQQLNLQTPYYISGKPGGATDMLSYATAGMTIHESRDFRIGEHEDNMDPTISDGTFGGVGVMNNKGSRTAQPHEYRTSMRSSPFYDEFRDDHGMVELTECIRYSGLWYNFMEDENPSTTDIGTSILSTFSSQWSILEWGSEDRWFIRCITHKSRRESLIRFLHLAESCGIITKSKEDEIMAMWDVAHADPVNIVNGKPAFTTSMKNQVTDGTLAMGDDEEDGESANSSTQHKINSMQDKIKKEIMKQVKKTKFKLYGVEIDFDTFSKLKSIEESMNDSKKNDSDLNIVITNKDESKSASEPFIFNLSSKYFGVDKSGTFFKGHIDDQGVIIPYLYNYIIPLEIPTSSLACILKTDEYGTKIASTGKVEIRVDKNATLQQIANVWINYILSLYLSVAESYTYDNNNYAKLLNNAVKNTTVKRGMTSFTNNEIQNVLSKNKYEYFPGCNILSRFTDKILTAVISGTSLSSNDFGKFQGKTSAIGELTHESFIELPHVKAMSQAATAENDAEYNSKREEWVKNTWPYVQKFSRELLHIQEELLVAYDCFSTFELSMDLISETIKSKPFVWKMMRSMMERRVGVTYYKNLSDVKTTHEVEQVFNYSLISGSLTSASGVLNLFNLSTKEKGTTENLIEYIRQSINFGEFNLLDNNGDIHKESFKSFSIGEEEKKSITDFKDKSTADYLVLFIDNKRKELRDFVSSLKTKPVKQVKAHNTIAGDSTPLERMIIGILRLWSPLDARFIRHCLANDLPIGLGTNNYRSHMTYKIGNAIMMDLHGAAGHTFFGHADFKVGKDVGKKMTYGSFHMYSAAVVTKPTLVQQIPCVVSKGYLHGNDLRFWDVTKDEHISAFTSGELDKGSIAPMIIPADWDSDLPFWDRTGKFGSRANVSADLEAKVDFPFAQLYNEKWNLDGSNTTNLITSLRDHARCNTLCFRDHQFYYNHATKMYDTWVKNKGPWGERVMPGCGKVRSGYAMHLEIPNYSESKTMTLTI